MSYFRKISDYRTYLRHDSEFHYEFNANSGGGQAFLGGKIVDTDGNPALPSELEGLSVNFALRVREKLVSLASSGNGTYAVSPRGNGSQSMKLGVQGKVNPSNLVAAALMLPKTCGRNMACSISVSPLTTENYWLRSMWLDVDRSRIGAATFIPKDFVFEGGLSKRQGVTTQKDTVTGDQQFFELDYTRRIEDVIALADDANLQDYAHEVLGYYRDFYLGNTSFDYEKGAEMVAEPMRDLSLEYCDTYSGYSDPLDFLMELSGRDADAFHVAQKRPKDIHQPRNLIYFGAPGTGKSYELNKLAVGIDGEPGCFDKANVTRVTFHPDYTYAQFVGCYKPYSEAKEQGDEPASKVEEKITYRFVPGPFLETYIKAVQNPDMNHLLVIEEINRANPAATFGDIFQLLDRKSNGASEYEVAVPVEMRNCLKLLLPGYAAEDRIGDPTKLFSEQMRLEGECERLCLPSNMYIWATMNSADQGVFPMDTAFKRRWDFRYMGINDGSAKIDGIVVPVGIPTRMVSWDGLRRGINKVLLDAGVNEDKLLGPFFVSPSRLRDTAHFTQTFMDKVLLYLFEDAAKTKKSKVFSHEGNATYSDICEDFKARGELAFKGMKELAPVVGGTMEDEGRLEGEE
ncbi:AAA domain-containing protein [Clostridium butyricum]|nr:AAA domain-containing protein [Gordonibacter pamelaeae]MZI83042.1 AAA domain-containing protein [Clostridium butyricum]